MESEKLQTIIDAILTKLCHDLINPLGSIQMAFEENEPKYLADSIKEALLKVDMYRFLYRDTVEHEMQYKKLQEYIKQTNLNIIINHEHVKLSTLIFFLSQKMLSKSSIVINQDSIELNYFFFSEKEINALNGKFILIDTANIIPYLAYLQYKRYHNISIKPLENHEWTITIKNALDYKE